MGLEPKLQLATLHLLWGQIICCALRIRNNMAIRIIWCSLCFWIVLKVCVFCKPWNLRPGTVAKGYESSPISALSLFSHLLLSSWVSFSDAHTHDPRARAHKQHSMFLPCCISRREGCAVYDPLIRAELVMHCCFTDLGAWERCSSVLIPSLVSREVAHGKRYIKLVSRPRLSNQY